MDQDLLADDLFNKRAHEDFGAGNLFEEMTDTGGGIIDR